MHIAAYLRQNRNHIIVISLVAGAFIYYGVSRQQHPSHLHIMSLPTTFPHIPPGQIPEQIKGKVISLRKLTPDCVDEFHAMFSVDVRQSLSFPLVIDREYTNNFVRYNCYRQNRGEILAYNIIDNEAKKLIGFVDVRADWHDDPGQFGIWLNENFRGKGRAQEALELVATVYFKLTGTTSFNAHIEMFNKRSFRALTKAGFKHIGFYFEHGKPTRYILEYYKPSSGRLGIA